MKFIRVISEQEHIPSSGRLEGRIGLSIELPEETPDQTTCKDQHRFFHMQENNRKKNAVQVDRERHVMCLFVLRLPFKALSALAGILFSANRHSACFFIAGIRSDEEYCRND